MRSRIVTLQTSEQKSILRASLRLYLSHPEHHQMCASGSRREAGEQNSWSSALQCSPHVLRIIT